MGLFNSKTAFSSHTKQDEIDTVNKNCTTPNGKAEIIKLDRDLDPRSPSENITRTPIQVFTEEPPDTPTPIYTPKKVILVEDPRSPTTEYHRTPVVVGVIKKSPVLKIHNKNLDKALKGYNTVSAQGNTKSETTTPMKGTGNIVPPRLLDTSPVRIVKMDAHKRRSFVGLLETNIDFTETDIDEVMMKKYHSPSIKKACSEPKIYGRLNSLFTEDNLDPRSPTTDFKRTPLQIIKKLTQIDANIADCASSEEGADENVLNNQENAENIIEEIIEEDYKETIINENEAVYKDEESYEQFTDAIEDQNIKATMVGRELLHKATSPHKTMNETDLCNSSDYVSLKKSPKITPEKPPRKVDKMSSTIKSSVITDSNYIHNKGSTINDINIHTDNRNALKSKDDLIELTNNYFQRDTALQSYDKIENTPNEIKMTGTNEIIVETNECCLQMETYQVSNINAEDDSCKQVKSEKVKMDVVSKDIVTPKKIDLTADLRDFDKKLTNLIYEDSDVSVLPPSTRSKDSNRTPLGVRNVNADAKKATKLKVSDRPRHSNGKADTKGNSKIPVAQNKVRLNKKVVIQCENTPPRNIPPYNSRKSIVAKPHMPQWDNDTTLII